MQIVLPPELEDFVQRQLASGKYQTAIKVILAGVKLLEQQEEIYQGRLQELQQEAHMGWEAAKFFKIAQFPNLGRQRNEILPGFRCFPIDQYFILYIPVNQDVDILRVVSGYRDLSALFADSDD